MAKIWKVPTTFTSSLPKISKPYECKTKYFALFQKIGKGRYKRISFGQLPAKAAVIVWGDRLLSSDDYTLRKVQPELREAK